MNAILGAPPTAKATGRGYGRSEGGRDRSREHVSEDQAEERHARPENGWSGASSHAALNACGSVRHARRDACAPIRIKADLIVPMARHFRY